MIAGPDPAAVIAIVSPGASTITLRPSPMPEPHDDDDVVTLSSCADAGLPMVPIAVARHRARPGNLIMNPRLRSIEKIALTTVRTRREPAVASGEPL
jgi:hypothetical protein